VVDKEKALLQDKHRQHSNYLRLMVGVFRQAFDVKIQRPVEKTSGCLCLKGGHEDLRNNVLSSEGKPVSLSDLSRLKKGLRQIHIQKEPEAGCIIAGDVPEQGKPVTLHEDEGEDLRTEDCLGYELNRTT